MNGLGSALRRVYAAEAAAAVLWVLGVGTVGPTLAQGSPLAGSRAVRLPMRASSMARWHRSTEFPFQVALYNPRAGSPAKGFFCGGVILEPRSVATAAHCLFGERGSTPSPAKSRCSPAPPTSNRPIPGACRTRWCRRPSIPPTTPPPATTTWGCYELARPLWSGAAPVLDGSDAIAPLVGGVRNRARHTAVHGAVRRPDDVRHAGDLRPGAGARQRLGGPEPRAGRDS